MDCSPPGSSVRGILQARILEGVAISFSRKAKSEPLDLLVNRFLTKMPRQFSEGKNSLFDKWFWDKLNSHMAKDEFRSSLIQFTNINSK